MRMLQDTIPTGMSIVFTAWKKRYGGDGEMYHVRSRYRSAMSNRPGTNANFQIKQDHSEVVITDCGESK